LKIGPYAENVENDKDPGFRNSNWMNAISNGLTAVGGLG
jgi:hypothetical protein